MIEGVCTYWLAQPVLCILHVRLSQRCVFGQLNALALHWGAGADQVNNTAVCKRVDNNLTIIHLTMVKPFWPRIVYGGGGGNIFQWSKIGLFMTISRLLVGCEDHFSFWPFARKTSLRFTGRNIFFESKGRNSIWLQTAVSNFVSMAAFWVFQKWTHTYTRGYIRSRKNGPAVF